MKKYNHLTTPLRERIWLHNEEGYNQSEIATMLWVHQSTISRELKRNGVKGWYDPPSAKVKARERRRRSKYQWYKIQEKKKLRKYIVKKLKKWWTPEMISWRIQKIDTHVPYVSTKGIYNWLYSVWWQRYCKYLKSNRTKPRRRKNGWVKKKRTIIPSALSISHRPEEANKRTQVWHYEADTIVSWKKTGSKYALAVKVDRMTRYTKIKRMPNLKPDTMNEAINQSLQWLPCRSITYDHWIENQRHLLIRWALLCMTYFCNKYCSWQKGTVEHVNGRIREFIPKGADISKYSDKEVQAIEDHINHTPRKCLWFKTPYEAMQESIQYESKVKNRQTKKTHNNV